MTEDDRIMLREAVELLRQIRDLLRGSALPSTATPLPLYRMPRSPE